MPRDVSVAEGNPSERKRAVHLVCPTCSTTNRVAEHRLQDGAVCGRCKAALLTPAPFALTDVTLPAYLAATELPVVVDFWAEWCGPCKMMAPQFAAAAREMPLVRFAKVDTEAAPKAAARHGIRSIPTLALFNRGAEVARVSGAMGASDLAQWIRQHL